MATLDEILAYGNEPDPATGLPRANALQQAEAVRAWHRETVDYGRAAVADPANPLPTDAFWQGTLAVDGDVTRTLEALRTTAMAQTTRTLFPDDAERASFLSVLDSSGGDPENMDAPERWIANARAIDAIGQARAFQPPRYQSGQIGVGPNVLGSYLVREKEDGSGYQAYVQPTTEGAQGITVDLPTLDAMRVKAQARRDRTFQENELYKPRERDPVPGAGPFDGFIQANESRRYETRYQAAQSRADLINGKDLSAALHVGLDDNLTENPAFLDQLPGGAAAWAEQITLRPLNQIARGLAQAYAALPGTDNAALTREGQDAVEITTPGALANRYENSPTGEAPVADLIASGIESAGTLLIPGGLAKLGGRALTSARFAKMGGDVAAVRGMIAAEVMNGANVPVNAGWTAMFGTASGQSYAATEQEAAAVEATDPAKAARLRRWNGLTSLAKGAIEMGTERIFAGEMALLQGQRRSLGSLALMPFQEGAEEAAGATAQNVLNRATGQTLEDPVQAARGGFFGAAPFMVGAAAAGRFSPDPANPDQAPPPGPDQAPPADPNGTPPGPDASLFPTANANPPDLSGPNAAPSILAGIAQRGGREDPSTNNQEQGTPQLPPVPTAGRSTAYGYANDETPDRNSSDGIGAWVSSAEAARIRRGEPSEMRLQPGDLAVSRDIEAQFRAQGIRPGDPVTLHYANGTTHTGRWMDRTDGSLDGRFDLYSPDGPPSNDGSKITGFTPGGDPNNQEQRTNNQELSPPNTPEDLEDGSPNLHPNGVTPEEVLTFQTAQDNYRANNPDTATQPEALRTLAEQLELVRDGGKPSMIFEGVTRDQIPAALRPIAGREQPIDGVQTPGGYVVFNKTTIRGILGLRAADPYTSVQAAARQAFQNPATAGQLLGYGVPSKPADADHGQVIRAADGTEVLAVVANAQTSEATAAALNRAVSRRAQSASNAAFREMPLAQFVMQSGGIMSRSTARKEGLYRNNRSLWDDAPQRLSSPEHNAIYGTTAPDELAQAAINAGLLPEGSTQRELWAALGEESAAARRQATAVRQEDQDMAQLERLARREPLDFTLAMRAKSRREESRQALRQTADPISQAEPLTDPTDDPNYVPFSRPSVRTAAALDAEYMAAVEAGDVAKQQAMVDKAAKAAGYNVGPVWHGTPKAGWTVPDLSVALYLTDKEQVSQTYLTGRYDADAWNFGKKPNFERQLEEWEQAAELRRVEVSYRFKDDDGRTYGPYYDQEQAQNDGWEFDTQEDFLAGVFYDLVENGEILSDGTAEQISKYLNSSSTYGPAVYEGYLKTEGFEVVDAKGANWDAIPYHGSLATTRDIEAQNELGAVILNVTDDGGRGRYQAPTATVYIVNEHGRFKSADPITRDDNGNVIPLSQRFQSTTPDIRFAGPTKNQEPRTKNSAATPKTAQQALSLLRQSLPAVADATRLVTNREALAAEIDDYRPQDWADMGPGGVQGFYDPRTGQTTVLLDNIEVRPGETPLRAVARIILHERIAHAGLATLRESDPTFARQWQQLTAQIPQAELQAIAEQYPELSGNLSALSEEWLAQQVEARAGKLLPPSSLAGKLWAALKSALARIFARFSRPSPLDAEVDKIIMLARNALKTQFVPAGPGPVLDAAPRLHFMRAYHGTPHKVDKFSTKFIGTGEGAQVYGWGLYFAEEEQTAEYYREKLGRSKRQEEAARKGVTSWQKRYDADPSKTNADQLRYAQQELDDVLKRRGNLYTVDLLPDEADFLDWDKPLSEQSEKVKAALGPIKALLNEERGPGSKNPDLTFYGSSIYGWFAKVRGGDAKGSSYLASIGIPGIKYLDDNSRADGTGTSNYVIFDDKLIKILEENGQVRMARPKLNFARPGPIRAKFLPKADRESQVFYNGEGAFRVQNPQLRALLTGRILPKEITDLVEMSNQAKASLNQTAANIARDLQGAVKLHAKAHGLTEADVFALVDDAMQNPSTLAAIQDPTLKEATRKARNILDDGSEQIAILTGGQLGSALMANRGHWMRRAYKAFDPAANWTYDRLKDYAAKGKSVEGVPASKLLNDAEAFLLKEDPSRTPAQIARILRDLMNRTVWEQALTSQAISKPVDSLMRRKDLAPELRAVMGEETNVLRKFSNSAGFQAGFLAKHEMQQRIADLGLRIGLISAVQEDVYTEALSDGAPTAAGQRRSGFAGLYTTKEFKAALGYSRIVEPQNLEGWFVKALINMGGIAKANAVALSPKSWATNIFGGLVGIMQNGHLYDHRIVSRWQEAYRLRGSGADMSKALGTARQAFIEQKREMMARLTAAGINDNSFSLRDMDASITVALESYLTDPAKKWQDHLWGMVRGTALGSSLGKFSTPTRIGGAIAGGIGGAIVGQDRIAQATRAIGKFVLGKSDNFFKVISFLSNYESHLLAGMPDAAAFDLAAEKTGDTMPNYSKVFGPLKSASKLGLGIGSFVSFTAELYRNTYHAVRYGVKEFRSSNPHTRMQGVRRLAGVASVQALATFGIPALIAQIYGKMVGDDDDEIARKWWLPKWNRYQSLAYTAFGPDKITYANTSYLIPQATLNEVIIAAVEGRSLGEGLANAVKAGRAQFGTSGIHTDPILQAIANRDGFDNKISEAPEGWEKNLEKFLYASDKIFSPGLATDLEKVVRYATGADKNGRIYPPSEVFESYLGFRTQTYETPKLINSALFKLKFRYTTAVDRAQGKFKLNQPFGSRAAALTELNQTIAKIQADYASFQQDMQKIGMAELTRTVNQDRKNKAGKNTADIIGPNTLRPFRLTPTGFEAVK